jgi:hypothetical protein
MIDWRGLLTFVPRIGHLDAVDFYAVLEMHV